MANEKAVDREALKAFRERTDERYVMEGEYSPKTSVGYSDSTGAIKTGYGVELNAGATIDGHLDEPFLFRPTAYPFNRDVITIGGQKATVKEVRAYAFVKNQLVQNGDFSNGTTGWNPNSVTFSVSNGVATITTTGIAKSIYSTLSPNAIVGHKYLISYTCKTDTGTITGGYGYGAKYVPNAFTFGTTEKEYFAILEPKSTDKLFYIYLNVGTIYVKNVFMVDLTQWFNNDTTILSKTNETWFVPWFLNNFGKYIPTYSTGEIENTYATQITTNGVNQWDGTNDIRVLSKTQYYCKGSATLTYKDIDGNTIDTETVSDAVFTTPDNCIYVGVSGSGDIQICLHWTETEIEQTYHPYEKWVFNIDWSAIGTPLGINSQIGDYKDFVNGKNGKVVGSVDLGTLNWSYAPRGQFFYNDQARTLLGAKGAANGVVAGLTCNLYTATALNAATFPDMSIGLNSKNATYNSNRLAVKNSNYTDAATFKAAMSGVILQYELAEPTLTDMAESEKLTNTYNVNDYGTEEFDNVCALDVLYQNNLVRQIVNNQTAIADHEQRIGALETEVEGIKGLPTAPSTNGNYRLRCTVTDGVATYTWIEES